MAGTLYITEVEKLSQTLVDGQLVPAPMMPPVAEQQLAIGAGSLACTAFQNSTRFVMVHTDSVCSLAFSKRGAAAPVATATAHRMGANETRFYGIDPGGQLAVIQNV